MTPDQITLVETSLAELSPHLDAVAADFYRRLFAAAPETKKLFSSDPGVQQRVFAAELGLIGVSIRSHEVFLAEARALGLRHRGYGVRASHFRLAGPHLIAALEDASGEPWAPELRDAWRLAYNLVAETMLNSAAGVG